MDLGGLENLPPLALTGGIGYCLFESLKIDYKFLKFVRLKTTELNDKIKGLI